MSLSIAPLKKELLEKAQKLGVEEIVLHFSGGNDEGYLNVALHPKWDADFAEEVENWAWEVYGYNGAGDGTDYGDDVTYNIVEKMALTEEWYMTRTEGSSVRMDFDELADEVSEDNNNA